MTFKPPSLAAASLRTARVANEATVCRASGCAVPRSGLEAYCRRHVYPWKHYGSPAGRPLSPRQWHQERKEVKELFQGHPDHGGLVSVTQSAARWLAAGKAAAGHPKAPRGTEEAARLASYGVLPLEVVTEACAFMVWQSRNPRACPDDRAWTFALALAVLRLAPRPRRAYRPGNRTSHQMERSPTYDLKPRSTSVEAVGDFLRSTWAPFFVTVRAAIEARDQQKADVLASMRAPFEPPRAVLVAEVASSG